MKKLFCIILSMTIVLLTSCEKSAKRESESNCSQFKDHLSVSDNQPGTGDVEKDEKEEFKEATDGCVTSDSSNDELLTDNNKVAETPKSSLTASVGQSNNPSSNEVGNNNSYSSVESVDDEATSKDETAVANRIIDYLNEYRSAIGNSHLQRIPGLTEYAKYRSHQLTSNFAHDTNDERAAATALKYGQYIDPAEFGMSGEPYYTAYTSEAIANSGFHGSIDAVAKHFADMCRNSPDHWTYISSSNYSYVGVGVTCYYGFWYVNISLINTMDFEK